MGWKIAWILLASSLAYSAPSQKITNFWSVDVGGYMSNVKERMDAPEGYASRLSTLAGYLRFRRGWHIGKNYSFEPSIGTMVPWRSSADGSTRTFITHIDLDTGIPLFSFLRFRTGPGVEWGSLLSSRQTVTLNNGTSTSDFYLPEATKHYFLLTIQGGFEFRISRRFSFCTDLMVSNLFSSDRRRYNAAVTVGIHL